MLDGVFDYGNYLVVNDLGGGLTADELRPRHRWRPVVHRRRTTTGSTGVTHALPEHRDEMLGTVRRAATVRHRALGASARRNRRVLVVVRHFSHGVLTALSRSTDHGGSSRRHCAVEDECTASRTELFWQCFSYAASDKLPKETRSDYL